MVLVPDLKRDLLLFSESNMPRPPTRFITFNGKTQSLSDWSRETLIPFVSLHHRLRRGWTVEEALTKPMMNYPRKVEGEAYLELVAERGRKQCRERNRRNRAAARNAKKAKQSPQD